MEGVTADHSGFALELAEKIEAATDGGRRLGMLVAAHDFVARFGSPHIAATVETLMRDPEYHDNPLKIASLLREWAALHDSGLFQLLPFEVASRVQAASDLMEQAQRLLEDEDSHLAAPVALAGAALEQFLRALAAHHDVKVSGPPGIAGYRDRLREAGHLSKQDAADVTGWADLRDRVAHGDLADLTRERVSIMAAGINVFLRRLDPGADLAG